MSFAVAGAVAAAPRTRRLDLDRAKGIAILLVVFGHLVAQGVPEGGEWYEPLRYLIYRFHMPFFLYLSGTVVVLSGVLATPPAGVGALLRKRAARLLPPFLGIGLLILGLKLVAMQVAHVDNPPEGLLGGLRDLFWTTDHSPAASVWYLLVLFLSTIVALLLRGVGTAGLVALGLALQWLPVPPIAYLDRFAGHFVFFAAGAFVAERQDRLLPLMDRHQGLAWGAFGLALAVALAISPWRWIWEGWEELPGGAWTGPEAARLVCGLLCLPALHGLIRCPPVAHWRWPLLIGRYAMVIYLFNTLAIGGAKAALILAGFGWQARWFPLHLAAGMLAGVAGPVLLKAWVLRRVPVLDRATD